MHWQHDQGLADAVTSEGLPTQVPGSEVALGCFGVT